MKQSTIVRIVGLSLVFMVMFAVSFACSMGAIYLTTEPPSPQGEGPSRGVRANEKLVAWEEKRIHSLENALATWDGHSVVPLDLREEGPISHERNGQRITVAEGRVNLLLVRMSDLDGEPVKYELPFPSEALDDPEAPLEFQHFVRASSMGNVIDTLYIRLYELKHGTIPPPDHPLGVIHDAMHPHEDDPEEP